MASQMVAFGVHKTGLIVNRHGVARVSYTTAAGVRKHVLAWGAINALTPRQGASQVHFKFDYSGGHGSFGNGYWKRMHNYCRRYTGPRLTHLVVACDAPDGSHWALQSWRRELKDGGWVGTARQQAPELHLSHWTGKMAQLFMDTSWLQNGRFDRVFGYLHYDSKGVYGFSATSVGAPTDSFGRNMYIDTHNPVWGKGWFRFNSGLTHRTAGQLLPGGVQALRPCQSRSRRCLPPDRDGPRRHPDRLADTQGPGQVLRGGRQEEAGRTQLVHACQRLLPQRLETARQ